MVRIFSVTACLVGVASAYTDVTHQLATADASSPNVMIKIDGPVSCQAQQRLSCEKQLTHDAATGITHELRTCMCIRVPEVKCKAGRVFTKCGTQPECTPTCKNAKPCGGATAAVCVARCECPEGTVDTGISCIDKSECNQHGSGSGHTEEDGWEIFHAEANGGAVAVEYEFEVATMSVNAAKAWCMSQPTCTAFTYGQAGKVEMLSALDHTQWLSMLPPAGMSTNDRIQGTYVKPLCNTPMHPAHGDYVVSGGGLGARAIFHCEKGYVFQGARDEDTVTRTCQADKTWSGTTTWCEQDSCSLPPLVEKATVKLDGNEATYTCDPGYSVVSDGVQGAWWSLDTKGTVRSVSIKCTQNHWPTRPKCTLDCGVPVIDLHTDMVQGVEVTLADGTKKWRPRKTTVGAVAEFKCKEGSTQMGGDLQRTCGADGKWSGSLPQCSETGCGAPPAIAFGEYATNGPHFYGETGNTHMWATGRIAEYNCEPGYQMLGKAVSTCQSNAEWSKVPVCTIIRVCQQTQCRVVRGSDRLLVTDAQKTAWNGVGHKTCKKAAEGDAPIDCRESWQSKCDAGHASKRPTDAAGKPVDSCHYIETKHKTIRTGHHASTGEEYGNRHRCSIQHPCSSEGCCECLCWLEAPAPTAAPTAHSLI
jgi:CUB/sushi domain-containing protein